MRPFIVAGSVWWCIACAHARVDEMSAPEHRNEAAIHTARADEQAEAFNGPFYSPTPEQLAAADREMRAAAEHLLAARRLEAFEDVRCAKIPRAERAACPLLASSVARVSETKSGILLELKPGADAVDIYVRLDCHLAYAIAQGFDRPSCPLFVKGMSIALVLSSGTRCLAMSSEDPKVAEQIREAARRVFGGELRVSTRD